MQADGSSAHVQDVDFTEKYNLPDEQLEYQVTDRLSFARFIGVDLSGAVPDAKTVWVFREALKDAKLWEDLNKHYWIWLSSSTVARLLMPDLCRCQSSETNQTRMSASRLGTPH